MTARPDPASFDFSEQFQVPFREAIDYFRQKLSLPSLTWRDIEGRAHDRAFVVAGATAMALVEDLRKAVDDAIAKGERLEQFRARFEEIVKKHGWTGWTGEESEARRAWRVRTIYETNLRTAYAAGRYQQMSDPDVLKLRPWWCYRHGWTRSPQKPRPEHVSWSGICLRHDDPWWETHYPPNGWLCSCGVEPMSARELAAENITPGEAPPIVTRPVVDPGNGQTVQVPNGIDFGWDHAPGRDWSRGLVPRELQQPLTPLQPNELNSPRPTPLPAAPPTAWPAAPPPSPFPTSTPATRPPAPTAAPPTVTPPPARPAAPAPSPFPAMPPPRPFAAPQLPAGQPEETYVDAFLGHFGAARGRPALWRDPAGHVVPIAEDLFRARDGTYKVNKEGRAVDVLRLAEALSDPDEIWVSWARTLSGGVRLVRSYLRRGTQGQGFAAFEWSNDGWFGLTAFPPFRANYFNGQRRGQMLWRREDK